jgi:hypothetical protein
MWDFAKGAIEKLIRGMFLILIALFSSSVRSSCSEPAALIMSASGGERRIHILPFKRGHAVCYVAVPRFGKFNFTQTKAVIYPCFWRLGDEIKSQNKLVSMRLEHQAGETLNHSLIVLHRVSSEVARVSAYNSEILLPPTLRSLTSTISPLRNLDRNCHSSSSFFLMPHQKVLDIIHAISEGFTLSQSLPGTLSICAIAWTSSR